jgi:hypothetical protein
MTTPRNSHRPNHFLHIQVNGAIAKAKEIMEELGGDGKIFMV